MNRRLWLAALVLLADQVSKVLARGMSDSVTLIPGILGLCHVENEGMAFSLASGWSRVLGIVTLPVLALAWLYLRRYELKGFAPVGCMLLLGGTLGNAVDRIISGSVTDMFEVLCFRFAIFNVADIGVTVGVGLLVISLLFRPGDWQPRSKG